MVVRRARASLVLRTTWTVLGTAMLIGFVASEALGLMIRRYETRQARVRVEGLLAGMEPSIRAACFVRDEQLAQETAQSLVNSSAIIKAEISSTEGLLGAAQQAGRLEAGPELVRPVRSPWPPEVVVGELRVVLNAEEVARNTSRYVWITRAVLLVLTVVMGLVLAVVIIYVVVRPIKFISDHLNEWEADRGKRLSAPKGHDGDEIGRLVMDVNEALDSVEARHRLEKQVQQAQVQKLNSLGSLAGGVAHDFNNMLTGILAYADLLLEGEQNPKRQEHLRAIVNAAARSSELTGKLLAFGRRGKNRTEAVDVTQGVNECLVLLKPMMHPDLKLSMELEPGLSIDGDPSQLQQILVNLCINAIEAMGGKGSLSLATRSLILEKDVDLSDGDYVEIRISDTGPGMSEEVLNRIFEPFFTTKTRQGESGTGLGLSTVYGIVASHHGTVRVQSVVGLGTTFRVLFPKGKLVPVVKIEEETSMMGKGRILVVEDEPIVGEVAKAALESLGYVVDLASDGGSGVEAYRQHHRHLQAVMLDLRMPVLSGAQAFAQMRAISTTVPILICTRYGENEEVQELLAQGAFGMIAKPYRVSQLSEILRSVLAKTRA
ncbi:MAG: ATP-binding protein [Firmicutes bacterium]|nr:ATP-binding protein [Bacillota bacterium]